jgi:hypothetical protein
MLAIYMINFKQIVGNFRDILGKERDILYTQMPNTRHSHAHISIHIHMYRSRTPLGGSSSRRER